MLGGVGTPPAGQRFSAPAAGSRGAEGGRVIGDLLRAPGVGAAEGRPAGSAGLVHPRGPR